MGQRRKLAARKDAPGSVSGMGRSTEHVAMKGAPVKFGRVLYQALGKAPQLSAFMTDVPTNSSNLWHGVRVKRCSHGGAPTKSRKEESARSMATAFDHIDRQHCQQAGLNMMMPPGHSVCHHLMQGTSYLSYMEFLQPYQRQFR